jgi:hypothetical protein
MRHAAATPAVLIENHRRMDMRLGVFIFMIDRLSGRETLKKPGGFSHQNGQYLPLLRTAQPDARK